MMIKKWTTILTILISSQAFALPFNITPKAGTTLPTVIVAGQTITAFYTVSNQSLKTLSNNYVQYLPPGTTQVTENSGISNLCGNTFNLAPHGTVGDSCTLQLAITQAINANDPDPKHHLFICLPGGKSCAGTYFPLNVETITPSTQWAAAGSLNDTQAVAAYSLNQGQSWQFETLAYPENVLASTLNGSSCTNQQCVLAGAYSTDMMLTGIVTSDGLNLNIWLQQILPPIQTLQSIIDSPIGIAYGINCYGNSCIASGTYETDYFYAYIAQSQDQGSTWTQQRLSPIDVTQYPISTLYGINCTGSLCVAVGGVYDYDFNQTELVAYSADNGDTWQQQLLSPIENTVGDQLNGVACSNLSCLAVGESINQDTGNNMPIYAITTNGGITWSNNIIESLPDTYTEGLWKAISCTSSFCVAAGYYSTTSYAGNLGIALTTDFGQTWTQQALPIANNPAGLIDGTLKGIRCVNDTCIATGYYSDGSFLYPVFVTSSDSGQTWTQQVYQDQPNVIMNSIG